MNYETDIGIDESALDVEWLEQPNLMFRYARHQAETSLELDGAKEDLEYRKAELDREIRTNPDAFGIEKVTDKVVEATIVLQKEYVDANQRLIKAKFEDNIAKGALKAIDGRKDALENLVRLFLGQYFAGPKIPRDLAWEIAERNKRMNKEIAKNISVQKHMTRMK